MRTTRSGSNTIWIKTKYKERKKGRPSAHRLWRRGKVETQEIRARPALVEMRSVASVDSGLGEGETIPWLTNGKTLKGREFAGEVHAHA